MSKPLKNRVFPNGVIHAIPEKGTLLGNRGGKIHDIETKTLKTGCHWASKQWICCELTYKDRQREVMGNSYTELFFLDEVTALAAGHRPCYECRRKDAIAFATLWAHSLGESKALRAAKIDIMLHDERVEERFKPIVYRQWQDVSHGAVVEAKGNYIAKYKDKALLWSPSGYKQTQVPEQTCNLLTPQSINDHVLAKGYEPRWHPSIQELV